MSVFDPTTGKPAAPHGGTFNANPVTMAAGSAALELLTPTVLDDLNELGHVARQRMQAVIHEAGVPWRVTGEASLFRFLPGQRELVGYRSAWADADSARLIARFTGSLLNHGVFVDHGGVGCRPLRTSGDAAGAVCAAAGGCPAGANHPDERDT